MDIATVLAQFGETKSKAIKQYRQPEIARHLGVATSSITSAEAKARNKAQRNVGNNVPSLPI
jgi:hypothetical protein